jgi:hypothetical protein
VNGKLVKLRGRIEITEDEEVERQRERSSGLLIWEAESAENCTVWNLRKKKRIGFVMLAKDVLPCVVSTPCPRVCQVYYTSLRIGPLGLPPTFENLPGPRKMLELLPTASLHKFLQTMWHPLCQPTTETDTSPTSKVCFHVIFFFKSKLLINKDNWIRVTKNN